MSKRFLPFPVLLATLLLAACNAGDSTPAPAATTPAAETAPATSPSADEPAAPASSAAPAAAGETTSSITPESQAAADAATAAAKSGPGPVAGTDYEEIKDGQPWQPLNGKIEVVEVFGYVCPACANFQPLVRSWKAKLPADVRFTYVPALFGGTWDDYARAFYAAESMGLVDKTHDAMYQAIHIDQSLKGERGRDSVEDIAAFYGKHGADPKQFASTMSSFAINAKTSRAKQFAMRSQISGTPTLIIDGKYLVKGNSYENMLDNAEQLIAKERAAGQ
jgi:thiol:disulfide interchange protein DsbA